MPGSTRTFHEAIEVYLSRCIPQGDCLVNPNVKPDRYGGLHYREDGRTQRMTASRAAFVHYHGSIPDGLHVLHTCDNPPCIARGHLYAGTHSDNMRDLYTRCRRGHVNLPRGESHHASVLTAELVARLREEVRAGAPMYIVAARHEVPYKPASRAIRGETWAWLTDPRPVAS